MHRQIETKITQLLSAEAILAGGTAYSDILPFNVMGGNASLYLYVTGDGTAQVTWVGAIDPSVLAVASFITPNGVADIVTAFTKTSGPGADGIHIYPIRLTCLVPRFALKVVETGGVSDIAMTAILATQ